MRDWSHRCATSSKKTRKNRPCRSRSLLRRNAVGTCHTIRIDSPKNHQTRFVEYDLCYKLWQMAFKAGGQVARRQKSEKYWRNLSASHPYCSRLIMPVVNRYDTICWSMYNTVLGQIVLSYTFHMYICIRLITLILPLPMLTLLKIYWHSCTSRTRRATIAISNRTRLLFVLWFGIAFCHEA